MSIVQNNLELLKKSQAITAVSLFLLELFIETHVNSFFTTLLYTLPEVSIDLIDCFDNHNRCFMLKKCVHKLARGVFLCCLTLDSICMEEGDNFHKCIRSYSFRTISMWFISIYSEVRYPQSDTSFLFETFLGVP